MFLRRFCKSVDLAADELLGGNGEDKSIALPLAVGSGTDGLELHDRLPGLVLLVRSFLAASPGLEGALEVEGRVLQQRLRAEVALHAHESPGLVVYQRM